MVQLSKQAIAASFSRAAKTYDGVAALQRDVGQRLLRRLPESAHTARWLDLGSGTGHFSRQLAVDFPQGSGCALDLAEGMLRHARSRGGADDHVAGDAEALPFRGGCFDLVFSSLALQWCADFPAVLQEVRRVLKPGGHFLFSSLGSQTLHELRDSWLQVDGYVHVNRFRSEDSYQAACRSAGLDCLQLTCEPQVLWFETLRQLTAELKALGAHNMNPGRPNGLTGRARLRALSAAYEQQRTPEGLPATYQVIYGVLRKPD